MDAWYHAAVTVTLFSARPSLAQFLLLLLLSRGIPFFTVKKQLLSLPKFSKLAASSSSAAVAATSTRSLGIPLSSSQLLPPIREPLDLFHFVELPAIVSLAFFQGEGKLYKLLTLSVSFDWGDFAHTVVVAHVLDDEILLYTTQHNSKCRE